MVNLKKNWAISSTTVPVSFTPAFLSGGQILVAGGIKNSSYACTNACYASSIVTDGVLTPFVPAGTIPTTTGAINSPAGVGIVPGTGLMYLMGGVTTTDDTGGASSTALYSFTLNKGGNAAAKASDVIPQELAASACVDASNGWCYILGGVDSTNNCILNTWAVQVSNQGHITGLKAVAQVPQTYQTLGLYGHFVVEANGYLICGGGRDDTGANRAEMYKAKILLNGDLGPWSYIGNLPSGPRIYSGAVMFDNTLIVAGGASDAEVSVFYSKVDLVNFDSNMNPISGYIHPALLPVVGSLQQRGVFVYNGHMYVVGITV